MSPRTVFYGHQNLMWECAQIFCDELLGRRRLTTGNGKASSRQDLYPSHGPEEKAIPGVPEEVFLLYLKTWGMLLDDYFSRELTNETDRMMAFTGVAQAFQKAYGLTYLAGAWLECLPHCLLWRMNGRAESSVEVCNDVPTWSRSKISRITVPAFVGQAYRGPPYPALYVCLATLRHFQWPGQQPGQVPETCFHDFVGLRITLELATFRSRLNRVSSSSWCGYWGDLDKGNITYCPDLPMGTADSLQDRDLLMALVQEKRQEHYNTGVYYRDLSGLAFVPGEEYNTWRRVGQWSATVFPEEGLEPQVFRSVFLSLDESKVEELTLV